MEERRKHIRRPNNQDVEFAIEKNRYFGTMSNLSVGSVFIQTKGSFSTGDTITVTYQSDPASPSGAMRRTGIIRRVTGEGIGVELGLAMKIRE